MSRNAPPTRKSEAGAMPALVLGTIAGLLLAFFAPSGESPDAPPPPDVDSDIDVDTVAGAVYAPLTFDTGSLIIPMDECHQYSGQTDLAATRTSPLCYCPDSTSDNGQIRAYGLIYRLLENGIPIYILINDAKTAVDGVDFGVTAAEPVKRFNRSGAGATGTLTSFYTTCGPAGSPKTINYRGAPFVIPAAFADQARTLIKSGSAGIGTPVRGAFTASTFTNVDVHVAQAAFTGKVARRYSGAPKPLALLNLGSASTPVLIAYLTAAGINTTGSAGTACTPGSIYGTFTAISDFTGNCLTTGNYQTMWAPHWVGDTADVNIQNVVAKMGQFVDSGRALFLECASIETVEGSFLLSNASNPLAVSSASYTGGSTKRWTVSGTATPGAQVQIRNARVCGTTYATVNANTSGVWTYTSPNGQTAANVPCYVLGDAEGNTAYRQVSSAPSGCSISSGTLGCTSLTGTVGSCPLYCNAPDVDAAPAGHFQMSNGLVRNGLVDNYGATSGEGFIFRDVTNVFVQKGDTNYEGTSGHIKHWKLASCPVCTMNVNTRGGTAGASVYKAGTTEFISSCDGADFNTTTNTCNRSVTAPPSAFTDPESMWDFFTFRRKDNDPNKGPIIYLGGHDYAGKVAGTRLVLNTLLNLEAEVHDPDPKEVVRSSPVVADIAAANGTITNTYLQGTFMIGDPPEQPTTFANAAGVANFLFPAEIGHVIALNTTDLPTGTSTQFADLDPTDFLWDAASNLPAAPTGTACTTAFNGSCRTLFTTTVTGQAPGRVLFNRANRASLKTLLGVPVDADADALINAINAGRPAAGAAIGTAKVPTLGGIDWSSMAVIEPSTATGVTRPTMVYVGGLDGMLHAFCANTIAPCTAVGRELWAYIPRAQLGGLRYNAQRIDGAPKVADMYGDFDGNGSREIRTILVFQTGNGDPATTERPPSVIAMDITSPGDPKIIWEVATKAVRTANEQGEGIGVAMGPVKISGATKGAVFFSTNNGGTGVPGMYVNALNIENGTPLWTAPFIRDYPNPARGSGSPPPNSGIPGGIAGVDLTDSGAITHLVVPTLYGEVYLVDAATGVNARSDALFRFTGNQQSIGAAPAIYEGADGSLYAVVISGAYIDPDGATWVNLAGTHYAASMKLQPSSNSVLNETGTDNTDRPFVIEFTGEAGFSSATIAGGELFFVTADHDVNDLTADNGAGKLHRVNLLTGNETSVTTLASSGAASVEATASGSVYAGSLEDILKVNPAGFNSVGATVEVNPQGSSVRRLWLRTE